jgi:hypothetical protein
MSGVEKLKGTMGGPQAWTGARWAVGFPVGLKRSSRSADPG